MKDKKYLYLVSYASGILRENSRDNKIIISDTKLKKDEFIIVEHINCGVFIARVVEDVSKEYKNCSKKDCSDFFGYVYLKKVDLKDWIDKIEKRKRAEELEEKMNEMMEEIDEKTKFSYYAQIDENFNKIFQEYQNLSK